MKLVKQLLDAKGHDVLSVSPDDFIASIDNALAEQ